MWVAFFTLVRWLSKNTRDLECGVVVCSFYCCCRLLLLLSLLVLLLYFNDHYKIIHVTEGRWERNKSEPSVLCQRPKLKAKCIHFTALLYNMRTRVELCVFVGVSFTTKSSFFLLPDHAMLCTFPLVHRMNAARAHVHCGTKQSTESKPKANASGRNGRKNFFRFRRFIEPTVSCYSSAIFDRWFSLLFKPKYKAFYYTAIEYFENFNCHFVSSIL